MKRFKDFKRVYIHTDFIAKHNPKVVENINVCRILVEFLFDNYGKRFEMGLCFVYKDLLHYYVGGSDDYYGYVRLNKIWLCYQISKSHIVTLSRVVRMLLKP